MWVSHVINHFQKNVHHICLIIPLKDLFPQMHDIDDSYMSRQVLHIRPQIFINSQYQPFV
jgi:hypothetical protein